MVDFCNQSIKMWPLSFPSFQTLLTGHFQNVFTVKKCNLCIILTIHLKTEWFIIFDILYPKQLIEKEKHLVDDSVIKIIINHEITINESY